MAKFRKNDNRLHIYFEPRTGRYYTSGSHRRTKTNHPHPQAAGSAVFPGCPCATCNAIRAGGPFSIGPIGPISISGAGYTISNGTFYSAGTSPRVDETHEDMPILAHRAARLVRKSRRGEFTFGSVARNAEFGIDADATCGMFEDMYNISWGRYDHPAPDLNCSCGFYALPPDQPSTYSGDNYVNLLVELTGKVIVHSKGYRAEHQRVVECQLPPCYKCGTKASHLLMRHTRLIKTVCTAHSMVPFKETGIRRTRVNTFQKHISVPVTRLGK